jgi:dipeptidyl aminopeptidase/acylaminoacyl peptidase
MFKRTIAASVVVVLICASVFAQETYKKPPQAILDVLNAPQPPQISVNPSRDTMLLADQLRYPPISDLAQPMLRLAGSRINPNTNGPHRSTYFVSLILKRIADNVDTKIMLPANAKVSMPRWSPDGKQFAFTNTVASGIELWLGDAGSAKVRKVTGVTINAAYGEPFQWTDSKSLVVQLVRANRGRAPVKPAIPVGPNVQETSGNAGPAPTYEDLLQNPYDEALWEYYTTSQLAFVDAVSGKVTPIGQPAMFQAVDHSPDGKYLLVSSIHRPFSFTRPAGSFPRLTEVWDRSGKPIHKIADLPVSDNVPIGGVRPGPRNLQWEPKQPSTLVWVDALDDGDPNKKVPQRDHVLTLKAPFTDAPAELFKTEHRLSGLSWVEKDNIALISDTDRLKKWTRTFVVNLDQPSAEAKVIWSRSTQDRYNDPGRLLLRQLPSGDSVVAQSGDYLFLEGTGASAQGDLPFFDKFNLKTLKSERIFRSAPNTYETLVTVLNEDGSKFLTRHETATEPPNYYVRTAAGGSPQLLTKFTDPTPILRKIRKQLVTYKRDDGVNLSFTLYLPPDYKEGTRLPTVVWAYPTEYNDSETASQVSGSTARFTTITGPSELFYVLAGYALLENAAMPVVGAPDVVNNTYVQQITMNAKAAIAKAAEMGVTDPNRVGVGGHSYGAFMTANLLAHTDLFKAGVARSGAYNRTLTPFGFQNEQRTLWEAPETYLNMSPFMYASKVKEPILFTHGEADDNTGTFPIQSDRMFAAVRGNGGTARLVTLPYEAHGYAARETIEHVLFEMISWFERFVKDVQPKNSSK